MVTEQFVSVFLSYDVADRQFAQQIGATLRGAGAEVVSINLQVTVGEDGLKDNSALDRALENVEYVVVVLSQHYYGDKWCR